MDKLYGFFLWIGCVGLLILSMMQEADINRLERRTGIAPPPANVCPICWSLDEPSTTTLAVDTVTTGCPDSGYGDDGRYRYCLVYHTAKVEVLRCSKGHATFVREIE